MNESIQSKGGFARAASLAPEQRKEMSRNAANARWQNNRKFALSLPAGDGNMIHFPKMSKADFDLMMETLKLWESKIVTP